MKKLSIFVLAVSLAAPAAIAAEQVVALKNAPGRENVEAMCAGCHSLDYIVMNSPYPNAALWDAEVTKMIKVFGAPISEADGKEISEYLTRNYGQP